jgi:hypothetical protein
VLAALRLNSPLRGSDSGSLGRQHRKPHDGSLAIVRAICFWVHHGCIVLCTTFYDTVHLHMRLLLKSYGKKCDKNVALFLCELLKNSEKFSEKSGKTL